ncbi:MAG: HNH endonuclease family protein [Corynebacterium sp.]|uniref:HNH endonuclease family protein n=1 Tax=Corynebacterium sp. TaxID=1720 RepID=UPI0026E08AC2|nr:HNH endonuclease family protein [Corynebacterium sp.]MDO5670042.1 HNH endonuclease family protein [Corynebacterium sp.]
MFEPAAVNVATPCYGDDAMKRVVAVLVAGIVAVIGAALLIDVPSSPTSPPPVTEVITTTVVETTVAEPSLLDSLEVKGRASRSDYDRAEFGQAWSDDVRVDGGRNGCDTRNDILRRDLTDPVIRPGTHGCLVESGTLHDPYSGEILEFVRGERSAEVQIDHIVALADAWQKGAQAWDEDTRRDFANDPLNLLAVDGSLNQQKGAGDAATWLPPNKAFRCDYATRIVEVKVTYGLWVTAAERDALARELMRCP